MDPVAVGTHLFTLLSRAGLSIEHIEALTVSPELPPEVADVVERLCQRIGEASQAVDQAA